MVSRVFIDRPIFAWVIAIVVMLAGGASILQLPIAQYPDVAPPQVSVRATYPGASAEIVQNSVTQVIEQSLTGIDGLLYFSSSSNSRGGVTINVTFESGTNADIAQVQVQNRVQQAVPRLPQQVQQQGVRVRKSNPDFLLIVAVYDETNKLSKQDVSDYLSSNVEDALSRIPGVGDINVFGSPYAMRIWLQPSKLASFQLMPGDVIAAVEAQNTEVAAGEIGGQPSAPDQYLNATVTAQSRLHTPDEFGNIILKTQRNGATVRIADVARVEFGSETYGSIVNVNGHPGAGIAVLLSPGADALSTAELVKQEITNRARSFPPGLVYTFANDSTDFIKLSVEEVVKTLIEAIVLVVIVMFIFLQGWRATLIPAIAVPVVLLGTFGVMAALGFSINTLTLFGLVLSIGLLVDDAIVVVENVERLLDENPGMSPRDATIESMQEISVALVAIALVLSAVFLPMAFFGGSTGVIYRQFSVTIVSAMLLSVGVALVLTPALTAHLLKPRSKSKVGTERSSGEETDEEQRNKPDDAGWLAKHAPRVHAGIERARNGFNRGFDITTKQYVRASHAMIGRRTIFLILYALICALLAFLFLRLPSGFLPTEDQGNAIISFQLPPGATINRAEQVQQRIETYFLEYEKDNVQTMFTVAGGGGGAAGQNVGRGYLNFTDWSLREGDGNSAEAITARATAAFAGLRDAEIYALVPPPIRGLGQSSGFTVELQNTGELSREAFSAAKDKLLEAARNDPGLSSVRVTELPDKATLKVDIDQQKLATLGLTQANVNGTLSTAWGGSYVNDFIDRGRVKRVYVQGDAPYRSEPDDLYSWFVRGSDGSMAPFSSFASTRWAEAPVALSRFNGIPSFEFNGSPAPGKSSGEAIARIEELAGELEGTSIAYAGLTFQERLSAGQAPILYGLSLLVVFLCLAALYESWSVPVAVLLIIPLGLVGAVLAVTLRGLINDVYLQLGLLTTMGLAAKNAILMIEFAEQAEKEGKSPVDAALEAARLRLRPILMTSLAFIFGVLPLALSTGAGANSRIAIGTAVVGGMLTATVLAIFYIPLFFVLVRQLTRSRRDEGSGEPSNDDPEEQPA